MLIRHIDDIPSVPYGEGAQKRVVFGQKEGAPTFAMRIFDIPPGGGSSNHAHDFEHEILILKGTGVLKAPRGDVLFGRGSALLISPNEQHQLLNTGTENLQFICLVPLRGEDCCCPL